jgi:hypothetical protein
MGLAKYYVIPNGISRVLFDTQWEKSVNSFTPWARSSFLQQTPRAVRDKRAAILPEGSFDGKAASEQVARG